jgi:xylulokinase
MELAATTEPGDGPVVLPYLAPGEQGALWDASLRGAVLGLHLGHGARHIARGLVDGIVLESRRCLTILEQVGLPAGEVRMSGFAGNDPHFGSELANATGRVVYAPGDGETSHSALGAAALGASAMDGVSMLSHRRGSHRAYVPDKARAALYDALAARHDEALAAIEGFSHAGGPH